MFAHFNRFEIQMTRRYAEAASHPGPCDLDVAHLVNIPAIKRQLDKIGPDAIAAELQEYGAWDADELADHEQNRHLIIWIAACNIVEELRSAS